MTQPELRPTAQIVIKSLGSNIEDLNRQMLIGKFLENIDKHAVEMGYQLGENFRFGGDECHYCQIVGEVERLPAGTDLTFCTPTACDTDAWKSDEVPDEAWIQAKVYSDAACIICHEFGIPLTQKYLKNTNQEYAR